MKNKIILGALLAIGFASIAYAAFSQMLTINGTATTTGDWQVEITSITSGAMNGAVLNSTPTYSATSATFDVNLEYPGASAQFDVSVANLGSIDAILDSVTGLPAANAAAPTDIQFSISGVTEGTTTLNSGTSNTVTVLAEWVDTAPDPQEANGSKTATINFNYIQNTP